MQKKKKVCKLLLLIVLLLSIILVVSCTQLQDVFENRNSNQGSFKPSSSSKADSFWGNLFSGSQRSEPLRTFERTGTKALDIKLLKDSPADSVFVGDNFRIGIYVKNIGASDMGIQNSQAENANSIVGEGKLNVINADNDEIQIKNKNVLNGDEALRLRGLSFDNPIGEERIYNFEATVLSQPLLGKTKFVVEACYPYETIVSKDVCIATSNDLRLRAAACEMKDIKLTNGQGAPVAVIKIVLQKPQKKNNDIYYNFLVYLDNVDKGDVVDGSNCAGLEKIFVNEIRLADKELDKDIKCNLQAPETEGGKQFIVLKNKADKTIKDKENIIKCTARFNNENNEFEKRGDFTTNIKIALGYTYSQSIEKEIAIKDLDNNIVGNFENQFDAPQS